ncbi:MAG: trigger factor family protein, partial [Bacteroidales bacterium]|nr:trigger factor family protein [Bacteroidales bacterium]
MKVTEKKIDDLNLEVTVLVEKDDYASAEKKRLNETRRNAEFKGFRKGMVPASLIQRVYGGQILADAVNEVVSEAL